MLFVQGLMTGGCAISQVGFTYITITLLNRLGLEQTLRVLGGILALLCVVASQFYLPTSYEHNELNSVSTSKRGVLFYLKLLRNKQFSLFVFANFICCFAYGVSSIHQVSKACKGTLFSVVFYTLLYVSLYLNFNFISFIQSWYYC